MNEPIRQASIIIWIAAALLLLAVACSDSTEVEPGPDAEDVVSGDFSVEPDTQSDFCGNGVVDDGEECDDENGVDADACSNDCELNIDDLCAICETDADCGGGGRCLPLVGGNFCGFDCSDSADYCPEGFDCLDITDPEDDERVVAQQCVPNDSCGSVDECAAFPDICGPGDCVDEDPGYSCTCDPGYEQTGDRPTCTDVDECMDDGICGVGTCSNNDGGFACDCPFPYVESGGSCAICPPEFALTLTMPSTDDCVPLAESDHQALLDRAIDNTGRVLRNALEAPRFVELSPIVRTLEDDWGLFDCSEDNPDCEQGIPFTQAADFIDELVDAMHEELIAADLVTAFDACSLTIELTSDMLCNPDETLPEACELDEDCPGDYSCVQAACERMPCTVDDDCNDGYRCGDDDFCEYDCIFDRLPVRIVAWPVDETDLYAEVYVGTAPDDANPVDVRIFDDQLSVIVDLKEAIHTAHLVSDAQGDENPMWPAVEDVEGILEIDLHEVVAGDYSVEINVRRAGPDSEHTGAFAEWTIDDMFDSYVNETPLPLSLEIAQACPLVFVNADDSDNILSVGTGIRPIEAVVPFALVNNGEGDTCQEPTPCCGVPEGCCTDGQQAIPCCEDELGRIGCCSVEVPCPCFDSEGQEIACPCYDDDGMPIDCTSSDAVDCPYDSDGNQVACLPNVGSLKLYLSGQSLRISMSVGDELEDVIRIDRIGFGDGINSLERDGLTPDQFDPILTLAHNLTTTDPTSSVTLQLSEDERGLLVDLVSELELDATVDTVNISDRITDLPDMLDGEVMRVLFTGSDPDARVTITDSPIRPFELVSGVLTLYSQYLEDTEDPPRDPPGTITIEGGECIVDLEEAPEGEDPHPFELIEGQVCPVVAPLTGDVDVLLDSPTSNYDDNDELTVGFGRVALMSFDLDGLPSSVTSARLDFYFDWANNTLTGDFGVFEVTEAWTSSTVTWSNRPATGSTAVDSMTADDLLNDGGGYVQFDVTSLVNGWLATPSSNHGLAVKNADNTGYAVFRSQEYENGRDAPRLVITE